MTTRTGKKSDWLKWLARYGRTAEQAAPCVLADDGQTVTVDRDHEAFPKPCENCGGGHATDACPIPPNFDGDYRRDSGGSEGCNCA